MTAGARSPPYTLQSIIPAAYLHDMSQSQTPNSSLEQTRAELIAILQTAPEETLQEVAEILKPSDPLREGNAPDETVVGYAGERAVTMGDLRNRARGADEAIARGETYTGEQLRELLRQKLTRE